MHSAVRCHWTIAGLNLGDREGQQVALTYGYTHEQRADNCVCVCVYMCMCVFCSNNSVLVVSAISYWSYESRQWSYASWDWTLCMCVWCVFRTSVTFFCACDVSTFFFCVFVLCGYLVGAGWTNNHTHTHVTDEIIFNFHINTFPLTVYPFLKNKLKNEMSDVITTRWSFDTGFIRLSRYGSRRVERDRNTLGNGEGARVYLNVVACHVIFRSHTSGLAQHDWNTH